MADPAQPPVNPINDDGDGQKVPIHNAQVVQGVDGGINRGINLKADEVAGILGAEGERLHCSQ